MGMDDHFTFFAQITANTTVLTPNRRLSATLRKYYHDYQIQNNNTAWPTPAFLPLTSWLQQLWNDYSTQVFRPLPLLLNPSQELFLWESIIAKTKNSDLLIQLAETAQMAKSAWSLLKQWQVDIQHPLFQSSEDYFAFSHWAAQFQQHCADNNWLAAASLPDLLMTKLKAKAILPSPHLILYGFTEHSPQLTRLLNTCEILGSVIQHIAFQKMIVGSKTMDDRVNILFDKKSDLNPICHRITLADHEDEIETMACWAKLLSQKDADVTIACVLPDLDKKRNRVVQIFTEIFPNDTQSTAFNISAGKNLSKYPIIYAALQLLSLYKKNISAATLNFLLTTPFIGEAEKERIKRAKYDAILRANNLHYINLPTILQDNQKQDVLLTTHCPYLAKRLKTFFTELAGLPPTLSFMAWTEKWSALLKTLGWPGERSLNSEEYQIVENWLHFLNEFQSLDYVSEAVSLPQALQMLQKMAKNRVFQPQSPEARIQVLGVLEAAGMPFDYIWVAGMDDVSWPPQPRPNPFIPKQLQRNLQMPHATAEREFLFCNMLTEQFKQHARSVIFSHAEKHEELELQPSPLIRNLPQLNKKELGFVEYISYASQIYQSKKIEWIQDELAPPVHTNEKIRGGVSILKHQSLCCFKAFAEWRLHAHELENPLPGLRAKDRGAIIHKTLEIIWTALQDHTHLLSLQDEELHALIQTSIENTMQTALSSHEENILYLNLEKQRLHRLIWEWLELEKQRETFRVIKNEKATTMTLGPLTLQIRIDRIDELSDGKLLIIDYKTGKNNDIHDWFSERPEEPQLPLYALLEADTVCGITFAQIHTSESSFKGVSHSALEMKGIKTISEVKKSTSTSWNEQLIQWRRALTQLSEDFYHGIAKINPKDPVQTCARCALSSLCRIKEGKLI